MFYKCKYRRCLFLSIIQSCLELTALFLPISVWWWCSLPLWRNDKNPFLPPFPHQSSSFLQMAGSDLSPASSWSTPAPPVAAVPPGEPSPHRGTTRWQPNRNAPRCPWRQPHPLCRRGWCRWQGRRSPPAWCWKCQICLWWLWLAWRTRTCCAQAGPACRLLHHNEWRRLRIWRQQQSYAPCDGNRDIIRPK